MSSALFYMAQSTSIRRAAQLHHTVSILLVADDTHDLGTPEEVVDAIMTEIGLSLAATTASKNVIYGLGQNYTPAQYQLAQASDLHWIPCNMALQIGGTSDGSFDYMVVSVNKTVDAIVSELQQFERFLHGALRARVQTIFAMICQCSTQWSTMLLSTRNHPSRLDTAVANTIFRITDSNQYLPLEHSVPMKAVFNQSFIPMCLYFPASTDIAVCYVTIYTLAAWTLAYKLRSVIVGSLSFYLCHDPGKEVHQFVPDTLSRLCDNHMPEKESDKPAHKRHHAFLVDVYFAYFVNKVKCIWSVFKMK